MSEQASNQRGLPLVDITNAVPMENTSTQPVVQNQNDKLLSAKNTATNTPQKNNHIPSKEPSSVRDDARSHEEGKIVDTESSKTANGTNRDDKYLDTKKQKDATISDSDLSSGESQSDSESTNTEKSADETKSNEKTKSYIQVDKGVFQRLKWQRKELKDLEAQIHGIRDERRQRGEQLELEQNRRNEQKEAEKRELKIQKNLEAELKISKKRVCDSRRLEASRKKSRLKEETVEAGRRKESNFLAVHRELSDTIDKTLSKLLQSGNCEP